MSRLKKTKGELTKERIINATLDLIASSGLAGLSHRNIATAADVRLSLTSYYFDNLDNLICCAFDEFLNREMVYFNILKRNFLSVYLDYYTDGKCSDRIEMISALSTVLTEHLEQGTFGERQKQVSTECSFIFGLHSSNELAARIKKYNGALQKKIEQEIKAIGSLSPAVDANILIAVIRDFELLAASTNSTFDKQFTFLSIKRLLSSFVP